MLCSFFFLIMFLEVFIELTVVFDLHVILVFSSLQYNSEQSSIILVSIAVELITIDICMFIILRRMQKGKAKYYEKSKFQWDFKLHLMNRTSNNHSWYVSIYVKLRKNLLAVLKLVLWSHLFWNMNSLSYKMPQTTSLKQMR